MGPSFTFGILLNLCFITDTFPKSLDGTDKNDEKVSQTVVSEIVVIPGSILSNGLNGLQLQPRQGFPGGPGGGGPGGGPGGPGGPGGAGGPGQGGPGGNNAEDGDETENQPLTANEANFVGSNVFKLVTSVWTGNLGGVVTGGLNLLNTRNRVNGLLEQFGVTTPAPPKPKNATIVANTTAATNVATDDEDEDEDYARELRVVNLI